MASSTGQAAAAVTTVAIAVEAKWKLGCFKNTDSDTSNSSCMDDFAA